MMVRRSDVEARLRAYETPATTRRRSNSTLFSRVLGLCLIVFLGSGGGLLAIDLPVQLETAPVGQRTTLRIREEKAQVSIEESPRKEEIVQLETAPTDLPDLTSPPEPPEISPELPPAAETVEPEPKEPRRVYGVRKVFAKGLRAGGDGSRPILSRRGNTLDPDAPRIEATEADLAGELAPLSSVTSAPVLIGRAKPDYTEEMIENRVSGTVRARLLIDVDGSVRSVEILEDIGYGSGGVAATAFRKLRFEPALRGNDRVAVWITMKFRFEIQE